MWFNHLCPSFDFKVTSPCVRGMHLPLVPWCFPEITSELSACEETLCFMMINKSAWSYKPPKYTSRFFNPNKLGVVNWTFGSRIQSNSVERLVSIGLDSQSQSNSQFFRVQSSRKTKTKRNSFESEEVVSNSNFSQQKKRFTRGKQITIRNSKPGAIAVED